MRENSPRSKKKQNKAMSAGMRFAAGLLVTLFVFNALSLPAFTEEIPESPPDDGYEYVLTDTEVSPEGAEVEEDSPEEGTEGNTEGIQDSTEGIDGAKDVPFSPEATENIPEDVEDGTEGAEDGTEGAENTPESGEAVPDVTADVPQMTEEAPTLAAADFGIAPMAIDIYGYSSDLADFLTEVVIRELNGTVIGTNGVVHTGEIYDLEFSFAEVPRGVLAKQFKYNEDTFLTYQLPSSTTVPTVQHDNITYKGGVVVGEYWIAQSGAVTAQFKNVDEYGNSTSTNFIDNFVDVPFTLKLTATFTGGSSVNPVRIDFGNNVIINLTVDNNPYLTVKKTAKSFDKEKRTIDYTVVVTAHDGTINNIKLTDVMKITASNQRAGTIPATGTLSIVEDPLVGSSSFPATPKDAGGISGGVYSRQYDIPLTGVSLAGGESATVTYSVQVADALFDNANNSFSSNTYNLNNTVTANGQRTGGTPVTPAKADAPAQFEITHLIKRGSLSQNGQNITWTVHVGDGYTDLRGATIKDTLGQGLSIQSNNIRVILYSDEAAKNQIPATVTPSIDGREITIVIPENPTVSVPVRRVVITYTSEINEVQVSYTNSVQLTYKGRQYSITEPASVSVGVNGFNVTKTGVFTEDGNLEYTIIVNVPGGLNGWYINIQDGLSFLPFGQSNIDQRLFVDNKPVNVKVTIEKADGTPLADEEKTTSELIPGDNAAIIDMVLQNDVITEPAAYWWLLFNAPRQSGETPNYYNAKWKINEASVVTVTYTINPSEVKVLGTGTYAGMTLAEALDHGVVGNQAVASLFDGEGQEAYPQDFILLYKPITKSGEKTYKDGSTWRTKGVAGSGYTDEKFYESLVDRGFSYTVLLNPYPSELSSFDDYIAKYNLKPAGADYPVFSDSYDPRLELETSSVKVYIGSVSSSNEYTVSNISDNPGINGELSTFSFDFSNVKRNNNTITFDSKIKYYVTYRLTIKKDAEITPGVTRFRNTATITINDATGDISYSDDAEVEYGRPIVTKTMNGQPSTTINVEIIVNPHKDTLALEGGDGTITVIDTMSPSLAFIDLSNINVTKENGDSLETAPKLTYDSETNSVTFKGLPDETAIKITYKALVVGEIGKPVNIANQVMIEGYDENAVTVEGSFVITRSSADSGGSKAKFNLWKTDNSDNKRLPSAGFALYLDDSYTGFDQIANLPYGIQKNIYIKDGKITDIAEGATQYYYLMYMETGANGLAVFDDPNILTGETYLLLETQAPAGYFKLEDPLLFYMSYGEKDKGAPSDVTLVIEDGGNITVTNDPLPPAPGGPRFPETGAPGTLPYTTAGAAMMAFALTATMRRQRRRRHFNDSA